MGNTASKNMNGDAEDTNHGADAEDNNHGVDAADSPHRSKPSFKPDSLHANNLPAIPDLNHNAILRNAASHSPFDAVTIYLTVAVKAWGLGIHDAYNNAIKALRKVDVKHLVRAIAEWYKKNPKKAMLLVACVLGPLASAALVVPLLGAVGFTAGGVAAGSIAAGIQAGIGNVAAGSLFAVLQSATASAFGPLILSGTVFGVTSAVAWGVGTWRGWFGGDDNDDDNDDEDMTGIMVLR